MPASNRRTAGGRGWMWPSSRPTRPATAHFSLQVLTNIRYFCRLSKKRKFVWPSASGELAGLVLGVRVGTTQSETYVCERLSLQKPGLIEKNDRSENPVELFPF